MKQFIKIISFCLALVASQTLLAQKTRPSDESLQMAKANYYLDNHTPYYAPEKSLAIYKELADKGSGKAMNAIGNLYALGFIGKVDNVEALKWYQQSSEAGYPQGWFNLGMMYKMGYGTGQNFFKAYDSFVQGAELKEISCIYFKGFMLYKGLGCKQDYKQAFETFKYGAVRGRTGSSFMLGLCYRNGYGTVINLDSARYWIGRSAKGGYEQAINELASLVPENLDAVGKNKVQTNKKTTTLTVDDVPQKATKIKQQLKKGDLKGYYSGYAVQYDWSGEHIIAKNKLELEITSGDENLIGNLRENDSISIPINAILTDTSLVFQKAAFKKTEHYSPKRLQNFEYKKATLKLTKADGETYLTGNLQLWNNDTREPEKLIYVSLKAESKKPNNQAMAVNSVDKVKLNSNALKEFVSSFVAYPNPFQRQLNLSFELKEAGKVDILLLDLSGKILYKKQGIKMAEGLHTYSLEDSNLSSGAYVVKLVRNGQSQSLTVIKQ